METNTFVTKTECEEYRRITDERLLQGSIEFAEIKTELKSLVSTCRLIAGAAISGIITVITILLTRGL